jgi:hypothetical protein
MFPSHLIIRWSAIHGKVLLQLISTGPGVEQLFASGAAALEVTLELLEQGFVYSGWVGTLNIAAAGLGDAYADMTGRRTQGHTLMDVMIRITCHLDSYLIAARAFTMFGFRVVPGIAATIAATVGPRQLFFMDGQQPLSLQVRRPHLTMVCRRCAC